MASRTLSFAFLGEDKSLSKTLKKVGDETDKTHGKLSGLGKVAVAGALGAGIGALLGKTVEFGKESVDAFTGAVKSAMGLSRVIGGTVEDASRLAFAAHETGVAGDVLAKSMGLFAKQVAGGGKALGKFGIDVKDSQGNLKSQSVVLGEVADKFAKMPNGPIKSAEALKLFGRQGLALIPLLNKGKDGIAEFGKEADKLGITVGGKDAAGLKAYIVQQRTMRASFEGLKISLGRSLFPIFTAWARAVAANGPKIAALAKNELPKLQHIFSEVGKVLGTVVGLLSKSADFFARNSAVLGPLVKIIGGLVAAFIIAGKAAKAFEAVMVVLDIELNANPVGAVVLGIIALGAAFTYAWKHSETFRDVVTGAFKFVATVVLQQVRLILQVVDVFARISDRIFGTHFHKSVQGAIAGVDRLQQKINSLGDKTIRLNVVVGTDSLGRKVINSSGGVYTQGRGGKLARALGGPVRHSTSYLVGENGPEMFTPNGSGYVTNTADSGRMLSGGGGDTNISITVQGAVDPLGTARQLQTMLLTLKRTRGTNLGLA